MDKQLIERIALEVAKDYLKLKLGDRKGLDIYDLDLDDEDLKPLISEIERECADSFMQFLTRIDAERGKEAVAKVLVHYNYGPDYKASVEWLTDCRLVPDTPLFLSPTIPEGMAKDAERFVFLQNLATEKAQAFFWNYTSRKQRAKAIDEAMLSASQGERNAD